MSTALTAEHRVVATDKEASLVHIYHRHVAVLTLEDGRRLPTGAAINNLKRGVEAYHVVVGEIRAEVEVMDRCSLCGRETLRTDRDSQTRNYLLGLPDSR